MQDLLASLVILFELLIFLWIAPLGLEIFSQKDRPVSASKAIFTLNLFYSYLTIDAITSFLTCICFFALSVSDGSGFSPSLFVLKWGGILLLIVSYSIQIPIKLAIKLLPSPVYDRAKGWIPDKFKLEESPSEDSWKDLFFPWIKGMRSTGHWFGLCIVSGTIMPYLGLLTVSAGISIYRTTIIHSSGVDAILGLLLLLSDWGGALVNFALMLNLLFVTLSE